MRPLVRVKLNPGSGRGRVPLDPGEAGSRVRNEQCSQFGCQTVTCVTKMDLEKLLVPWFKRLRVALMTTKQKKKKTEGYARDQGWGHLKKLTSEAQQMVEKQEVEATSSTMFLALLALVSCQSSVESCAAKSEDYE
ncbi:hypothetical protein QTO34_013063 [Cnephaeus nilssonii]|uniref:Uncharacterized protein n=1 Tax=Cnephaeus nilssonii TaxID=3371016 RepID=A0AA40HBA7_CNENI|nr:hypothetical protein QTO34_013063 [Eptesicus nilssonii]